MDFPLLIFPWGNLNKVCPEGRNGPVLGLVHILQGTAKLPDLNRVLIEQNIQDSTHK